jgi:hypothetical protein
MSKKHPCINCDFLGVYTTWEGWPMCKGCFGAHLEKIVAGLTETDKTVHRALAINPFPVMHYSCTTGLPCDQVEASLIKMAKLEIIRSVAVNSTAKDRAILYARFTEDQKAPPAVKELSFDSDQ